VPAAGDPQVFNRYAYGRNNPIKYIDRDGHIPIIPLIVLGIMALGSTMMLQQDRARTPEQMSPEDDFSGRVGELLFFGAGTAGSIYALGPGAASVCAAANCPERVAQAEQELSPQAEQYLAQLQEAGDRVVVPRGQISAKAMAQMTKATGDEFMLFRSKDSLRYLMRGNPNSLAIPEDIKTLIAHTHPGTELESSGLDSYFLEGLIKAGARQNWSILINEVGQSTRWYVRAPLTPPDSPLQQWMMAHFYNQTGELMSVEEWRAYMARLMGDQ
jgi:hypothetical protein